MTAVETVVSLLFLVLLFWLCTRKLQRREEEDDGPDRSED